MFNLGQNIRRGTFEGAYLKGIFERAYLKGEVIQGQTNQGQTNQGQTNQGQTNLSGMATYNPKSALDRESEGLNQRKPLVKVYIAMSLRLLANRQFSHTRSLLAQRGSSI